MKRFLPLFFCIFPFILSGGCFQPADGINLWRLTAQVGSCVDVYSESILDDLDVILCSVGKVFTITQANFTPTLTLSQPGYYKICENCTVPSGVIFVNSDNVILDLGNYFLDSIFVFTSNGLKNITIKNGLMRNRNRFISIGSSSQNIIIQNMVFESNTVGVALFDISASGPLNGLIIRDVTLYDAAPENIMLIGTNTDPITNVVLENIRCMSTNQTLAATIGSDATIHLMHCNAVSIKNVVITDPLQDLDAIFLKNCDGVKLEDVDITSSLAASFAAAGVRLDFCNNIDHHNVSVLGVAFNTGFKVNVGIDSHNLNYNFCVATHINSTGFLLSSAFDVIFKECIATECVNGSGIDISFTERVALNDCTTNLNEISGLRMTNALDVAIQGHNAVKNNLKGLNFSECSVVSIADCFLSQNQDAGLYITNSFDMVFEDIVISKNSLQGISVDTSEQLIIKNTSALENGDVGIKCDSVNNVLISGCEAQKNGGAGFFIKGVNGGNMPGDPEGITGRSPVFVDDCSAFQNGATGFYFTNVGGVFVRGCFASYNINGYGFHFDSGSWNVQVEGCYATSNALVGFITWDSPIPLTGFSLYNNRFRDCYASRNNTNFVYNPFAALSDFATSNTPGLSIFPPIGTAFNAATLTTSIVVVDVVPANFCGYQ